MKIHPKRNREGDALDENGFPYHEMVKSHQDVTGKWGGFKAWVVTFARTNRHFAPTTRQEIYINVGDYWDVGALPPDFKTSRWEMAELYMESLKCNFCGWSILTLLIVMIKYRWEHRGE